MNNNNLRTSRVNGAILEEIFNTLEYNLNFSSIDPTTSINEIMYKAGQQDAINRIKRLVMQEDRKADSDERKAQKIYKGV